MSVTAHGYVQAIETIDGTNDRLIVVAGQADAYASDDTSGDTLTFDTSPVIVRCAHSAGFTVGSQVTWTLA
jgi:hypothetical protein